MLSAKAREEAKSAEQEVAKEALAYGCNMKKGNISIFVPHLGCPCQCSFCNQKTITGHNNQPSTADVDKAVLTALKHKGYDYEIAFSEVRLLQ